MKRWSKERTSRYAVRAEGCCVERAVIVQFLAVISLSRKLETGYSTADRNKAMESLRCSAFPVRDKSDSKLQAKSESSSEPYVLPN